MKRKKIRSKFDFENLYRFMLDSVGSLASPNNIAEALTVRNEQTFNREITTFQNIKDNYPKYLLTLDPEEPSHNGVLQINVIRWLSEYKKIE
jgi:predicted AAA+ superfamily ATPase